MKKEWQTQSSSTGYHHPFFRVRLDKVKLPNGIVINDYAVWENADVAQTVPYRNDGKIALVKQYKQGAQEIITEFPGGFVEKDESPEQSARRELLEETNLTAMEFLPLASIKHHPTKETSSTHLFLAKGVTLASEEVEQDPTEDIELIWMDFAELIWMIEHGKVKQSGTVVATFLALRKLGIEV